MWFPCLLYQGSPYFQAHFHWGGVPQNVDVVNRLSRHIDRVRGKYCFHSRCINWSYRNRGYEARIHRNRVVRTIVFIIRLVVNSSGLVVPGFMNIMTDRVFISRMFVYSARNRRAKGPAENSRLNPETSSDSPSVRSKGDRLVSARVEVNHIMASGQDANRSQECSCSSVKEDRE